MNHNEQGRVKLTLSMTTGGTKQTALHWRQKQVQYKYLFEVFLRSCLGTVTRAIYSFTEVVLIKMDVWQYLEES